MDKKISLVIGLFLLFSAQILQAATISGTVFQNDGNTPFTKGSVQIRAFNNGSACGNRSSIDIFYTDETDGTYSIDKLPAGDYYLYITDIGKDYVSSEFWASDGSTPLCDNAELVSVSSGDSITGKDFQVQPGATISGKVISDQDGQPVSGIKISAMNTSVWRWGHSMKTGDDGVYAISGLLPGNYLLEARSEDTDYAFEFYKDTLNEHKAQIISAQAGQPVTDIDFSLGTAGDISGIVQDSDGNPIEGITVAVCNSGENGGHYVAGTDTAADGTYHINGVPAGMFTVEARNNGTEYISQYYNKKYHHSDADLVEVFSGKNTENINFQLDKGGTVSGTVTDADNQPVSDMTLQIYDGACWDNHLTNVVTDSSGSYVADGLPQGDVYIRACSDCNHKPYQNIWWDGTEGLSDALCSMAPPVNVVPGQETEGIDFTLTQGQRRAAWYEIAVGNGRLGAGFGLLNNFKPYLTGAELIFPNGDTYTYNLANDYFDMRTECSGSDGWWNTFNEPVTYGNYTISLSFQDGVTKTYTKQIRDVPLPPRIDSSSMTADVQDNGDIVFSWEKQGSGNYYQVRIYDSVDTNKRYYRNAFAADIDQLTVSADQLGCLKKGESYLMQVRIYDDPDWNLYQARSRSDTVSFTYSPGSQTFQNRVKWFEVYDWRGSFSYGFCVRSGSMENITSAIVTRPDNTTYTFDLTEDWYDNSSETHIGKGWWASDGQTVEGNYTLQINFADGYSETRSFDWAPPAVTVTPVDSGTMNQQVFQDGSIDFSWDTTGLDPQLKHQIIVHSVDDTKRFYRSRSETDRQNITVYQYDLRGLEFGKTYIWYVRTYSPSYTTAKYSQPKQFVYDPFEIGSPITGSFPIQGSVMNYKTAEGTFTYLDIYIGTGDFDGQLINSVECFSITGSDNLSLNKDDIDYWFDSYWKGGGFNVYLQGSPTEGEYSFSVKYTNGDVFQSTDIQGKAKQIPVPSLITPVSGESVNTLTPTFSWEAVSVPGTTIYYRLQIQDADSGTIFTSDRQEGMLEYKLDSDILEAGKKYFWRVRATDSGDFVTVNNRAQTDYRPFTISSDANVDADGDGVIDAEDQCPGTPAGTIVYENGCSIVKGDINLDKKVDLKDSMLGLKVMTGLNISASNQADVDGDGKIGYEEAIYPLQIMSIEDVLSGIWKLYHSEGNEEEGPEYIEFIQSGNTISGSYMCNDPDAFVGTLKGASVSLTLEEMDESYLLSGTINGDSITGTFLSTEGDEFGTWRAERTSESCPSPKSVPTATISVDGNTNDWAGINPVIIDPSGDGNSISGSDIGRIFLVQDSQNLYVRIDLENGSPLNDLYFGVAVRPNWMEFAGDRFVFINTSNASCSVESWTGTDHYHTKVADGNLAVSGSVIEGSVPISALDPSDKSFVSGWNDTNGPPIDETNTVVVAFITESNSDADFAGPWIVKVPSEGMIYVISNGAGGLPEYSGIIRSGHGATPSGGTYRVDQDGALSLVLDVEDGGTISVEGTLESATEGIISSPGDGTVQKVVDTGLCEGTWIGTLTENGDDREITLSVDSAGDITSFTGLQGPVSGRMFSVSGNLTAYIKTGEPGSYNQVALEATLSGDSISGDFHYDGPGGPQGTVSLTRSSRN